MQLVKCGQEMGDRGSRNSKVRDGGATRQRWARDGVGVQVIKDGQEMGVQVIKGGQEIGGGCS